MECNELYHHGTKGMHWGQRLYQNRDGSLTALGRLRYGNKTNMRAAERARAKKIANRQAKKAAAKEAASEEQKKTKPISKMSDAELKDYINRMTNEKQAYNLQKEVAALKPQKVSAGKRFITNLWDKTIAPAVSNAGKDVLENYLKKIGKEYLGLNEKQEKSLKDLADESEYKKKIAVNNDFLEQRKKKKAEKAASEKADKKEKNDRQKTDTSSRESSGDSSDNTTYTGTVYGEGTSRRRTSESSTTGSRSNNTYYTTDWRDTSSSARATGESYSESHGSTSVNDLSGATRQLGQSYIAGLLPAPKDRNK